jgi:hypothetical protein
MLNSIVRGFGLTIGRRAADNMIDNLSQSSGEYKSSPSLSGKQIFKTILWSFMSMILAIFITSFLFAMEAVDEKNVYIPFLILTLLFTFVIGKGYYDDNKRVIDRVNTYNKTIKEKERLTKQTEELYVSEKITKREYEVLMMKINKL